MKQRNLILFYHIVTGIHYCWNGEYPVNLSGSEGEPWHPKGELTEQEEKFFQELETSKKRTFELKGKGKFTILQRIKTMET